MRGRPRGGPAAALPRLLAVAIAALGFVFVALQVNTYTLLSPIDELQHIDYLYRAPGSPAPADRIGQEALHQQDCRGIDAPGFGPPLCRPLSTDLDPLSYQEKGYNTAAANTPVYYTATRGVAEAIKALTPADDLVTAGRLTGGLWFALGLALTFLTGRRRGVPAAPMAAVTLLLASTPALIFPSATITPDASGLVAGAALVLAMTWWEERPSTVRALLLVVVGIVVAFAKMTNLVVVAAVVLYLLLRPTGDDERDDEPGHPSLRARWTTAVTVGLASVVAAGAWLAYVGTRPQIPAADLPDMASKYQLTYFPWTGLVESSLSLLQPLSSSWAVVGSVPFLNFATAVVAMVLLAGTLAAALFTGAPPLEVALARSVVAAAVVGALLLVTAGYLFSSTYFPIPVRYGIALVAPMAIVTASMIRSRSSVVLVGSAALLALAATAFRLGTLA
ncbi:glycosyltransferase family 39 protein [Nocardioides glacieisoli]|nr:glycosyltransferase family 39 protein [Nocardioides glacieisoli]